jgi:Glycine zipper
MKKVVLAILSLVCVSTLALAQAPAPAPAPNQITPQTLAEMLRTASTFHELVRNLNMNKALGPDVHVVGADGVPQHSTERTAATIGAGAGVGAAIGGMTRNQNGVLIGALIGGASGLIVDEIMKHREETHPKPVYVAPQQQQAIPAVPEAHPLQFRERQ